MGKVIVLDLVIFLIFLAAIALVAWGILFDLTKAIKRRKKNNYGQRSNRKKTR